MSTTKPVVEVLSPDSPQFQSIPPNPSSAPKHVEGKVKGPAQPGEVPSATPGESKASVSYLGLLTSTDYDDSRWRKCMVETPRFKIYHWEMLAYTKIPMHQHPEEQFGYVHDGALLLEFEEESHTLYEGDSYFIPSNMPHALTALYNTNSIRILFEPRS